ncbi:MAG: HEAT repeat domain-containing protein [Thermoleophilia bacterium]|nr:HEAT repeat domain-containing protein [Thermoleophilia bacterium]
MAAVTEICARLQSAYRTMRLYPPGHSMIESRMQPLTSAVFAFLSQHDSLPLQVEESSLTYRGEPVFQQDPLHDDMAFILFREGIRRLTLYEGLEGEEVRGLVDRFSRALEAATLDQDLVTLLWEADFAHIDYDLVDPLQLEPTTANSFEALKADARAKLEDSERADLSLTTAGWRDFDPTLPPLEIERGVLVGPEELAVLEQAIKQEPRPLEQFVAVLLEMLACSASDQGAEAARDTLSQVLLSELQQGDLASVLPAVARLRDVRERRPDRAAVCEGVLAQLAKTGALRAVVLGLDGALQDRQPDLEALLPQLAPHSYPALLDLLAKAEGRRARKCILDMLATDRRLPLTLVKDRLSDPRWFVVRNLVLLLGAARDRCPAEYLLRPLRHTDERVRREAVRSLAGLTDGRASTLLRSALSDQSPTVRTAAAQALGRRRDTEALPDLLNLVQFPGFAGREPAETAGVLEAVAALSDDRALPTLARLWEDRLMRSQPLHVRVGALRALAAIGTPAAVANLERARRSRNRDVRQEAERCLLGLKKGPAPAPRPGG